VVSEVLSCHYSGFRGVILSLQWAFPSVDLCLFRDGRQITLQAKTYIYIFPVNTWKALFFILPVFPRSHYANYLDPDIIGLQETNFI
jgi:hypothetical protein